MTEHLARHRLEALAGAHLDKDALEHLAHCGQCAERRRALEHARQLFRSHHPALAAPPLRRARRRATFSLAGTSVLVAAAAVLLWLRAEPAQHAEVRFKGQPSLEFYVKQAQRTERLQDGAALAPGAQLGFVYRLPQPQYLLLLGIDDGGAITRYYPPDGAPAQPLPAQPRAQLPVGVELDDRRGEERMIALFSPEVLDEARARRALRAAFAQARQQPATLATMPPLALPAAQVSVWFRKP